MKHTILCAALLITITTANAQKLHFGPKFDINYSSIDGDGLQSKYKPGFQVGGFLEWKLTSQWSIQPELLYNFSPYQKADDFLTYYNNSGRSAAGENVTEAYISVPVLLRFNLSKVLAVLAGPEYSYLIWDDEDLIKDDRQAFKNSEFSANIGVQANIGDVGFYARFNKGLSNINNVDDRYQWKSNHVQVGVAVAIK